MSMIIKKEFKLLMLKGNEIIYSINLMLIFFFFKTNLLSGNPEFKLQTVFLFSSLDIFFFIAILSQN